MPTSTSSSNSQTSNSQLPKGLHRNTHAIPRLTLGISPDANRIAMFYVVSIGGTMRNESPTERVNTVVIGAGQAGLSVGYHLSRRGVPFVILDANERIGDQWRHRWDSLRLFTPAQFAGLDGMAFPTPPHYFPTKDEMGDFLEHY